jgi:hypothetical protein
MPAPMFPCIYQVPAVTIAWTQQPEGQHFNSHHQQIQFFLTAIISKFNQLISILQYQYEQMTTFCRTESCKRYNDSRTFKNMAIIHTLCRENMFASIVQESTKYELQSWYVLLLQKKNAVTHLCVTVISLQKLITPYVTNKCITKNNMRKVGSG